MKYLFLSLVLFSGFANASSWNKTVMVCDQAKIEDICWDNGVVSQCRRQLIVFGEQARNYFFANRMLFPNGKNELIAPIMEKIPNSQDYRDTSSAYQSNGRVIYIKPLNGTVTVESFRTTQATGGVYSQQEMVGSYIFYRCQ